MAVRTLLALATAVAAWTFPAVARAQESPPPQIPCSDVSEPDQPPLTQLQCAAYRLDLSALLRIGETATIGIDTNLSGEAISSLGTPLFIGDQRARGDSITVDSGEVFPGGIAFRRFFGTAAAPTDVTAGAQLGYIDFRGYSGGQFFNAGSFDVIVDPAIAFASGQLPPTRMRFSVSNGQQTFIPMEITASGTVEINSLTPTGRFGPGALGTPRLWVNQVDPEWAAIFAAQPAQGPGFALRLHTLGETAGDYLIGGSSGQGTGSLKFSVRGNGDVYVGGKLMIGSIDVASELARLDAAATSSAAAPLLAIEGQGALAVAAGGNAIAIGGDSRAEAAGAVALGHGAAASGAQSTALGDGAVATHASATAVGNGAITTAANQVTLGGTGTSVRLGDIAASTAAQAGPVQAVTVDSAGTLGRQSVATAQSVQAVGTALQQVAAIGDTQFSALDARVGSLFDLRASDRKDFKQGIAAVAAMAAPHFPSEAGRTSYASNVAVFRGEVGFSAGIAHRFEGDFALTAGATFAGGKNTAVKAGIEGEF